MSMAGRLRTLSVGASSRSRRNPRLLYLQIGAFLLLLVALYGPLVYLGSFSVQAHPPDPTAAQHPGVIEEFAWNVQLFRCINGDPCPALDVLFSSFWFLGNGIVLLPVLFLLAALRPHRIKYLLLGVFVQTSVVHWLKAVFSQPRPPALLEGVRLVEPLYSSSFPSGDAALAFVLAFTLLPGESRRFQAFLVVYALLVALERVYMGVHFPLDVMVGAALGAGAAGVAHLLINSLVRLRSPRTSRADMTHAKA
jgi:membrane-associated phospholipid phosphatase